MNTDQILEKNHGNQLMLLDRVIGDSKFKKMLTLGVTNIFRKLYIPVTL